MKPKTEGNTRLNILHLRSFISDQLPIRLVSLSTPSSRFSGSRAILHTPRVHRPSSRALQSSAAVIEWCLSLAGAKERSEFAPVNSGMFNFRHGRTVCSLRMLWVDCGWEVLSWPGIGKTRDPSVFYDRLRFVSSFLIPARPPFNFCRL